MRLPQNGTITKCDDVPSSRLCGGRGTIGVTTVKTCEIGVNVTVEVQSTSGLDDHARIASAVQVTNESLDGGCVVSFRVVAEPGDLADGKSNVRASVGRQIKEHTDNRAVASCFCHGRSVGINSKCGLGSWRPIVVAVGHACCFFYLLNEAFIGESEGAVRRIAGEIDVQEVGKRALASET